MRAAPAAIDMTDVESLLAEVSVDSPCGDDLEYDPAFLALAQAALGQRGDGMIGEVEGEGPDWRSVGKQATELLGRTKDLRVGVTLVKALTHTEGIAGMSGGLGVVRGLLERFWPSLHPALDPDDDNDPTMRLNTLRELCDREVMLHAVRMAPLVRFPALGNFGLRDIGLATGELKLPEGSSDSVPGMDAIDGAFANCDVAQLEETAAAVQSSIEHVKAIETFVTEQVGLNNALRLESLSDMLRQMDKVMSQRLAARGVGAEGEGEGEAEDGAAGADGSGRGLSVSGQVRSRDDVIRLLDKICDYYMRCEPSSPVPVLLQRCKKLVPMQFKDIVQELLPDGFSQFAAIRGPEDSDG